MNNNSQINLHATAVSVANKGLLILGASGSGKSKLALVMLTHGAKLISDDQVLLKTDTDKIILSAPRTIIGKIEARYIGILNVPAVSAQLFLAIDLDKDERIFLEADIDNDDNFDLEDYKDLLTFLKEN